MATALLEPDLLNAETFKNGPPHAIFDRLRDHEPLYRQANPLGGNHVWSLTRFADIRAVGSDTGRFTIELGHQFPTPAEHARAQRDNIMFNDPPRHTRLRSFAAKAFSPPVVAKFDEWIRGLVHEILDKVEKHDRIDMVPMIAAELPGQVICSIMGVPHEHRHKLIGWATDIFGRLDPGIGVERAVAAVHTVKDFSRELRQIKEREPGVDMTTELLSASYGGTPITDGEFIDMVMSLILAGFETTHTLIAQGLTLIAQDADVRRQVEDAGEGEMRHVTEEMLRFVSPVMHMARTAKEDVELHGKTIAKGDIVMMWFTAANRDPAMFDDPHSFMAARGRRGHAAFGAGGPHFCLGNHLARLEGEILFDEMRQRNLRLELDGEPKRARGIFINALRSVPMKVAR
ncbi:cholest-4-en-3-one 26-monooxygenase [Sphingobium faniae]|nr:cholest-4-en-3-one 26-monooxygenase [Sphingobium faniae]